MPIRGKYDRFVGAVFIGVAVGMVVAGLLDFFGAPPGAVNAAVMPTATLAVVLLITHGSRTMGFGRLVLLAALAAFIGFGFEYFGVRTGTVFGGHYRYNEEHYRGVMVFDVPVAVPVFWAVFIYTGYSTVNTFLLWLGRVQPRRTAHDAALLLLLVALDSMMVMALDMFMDPIVVNRGGWEWADEGPYFGIPIGNFVGWFVVTAIVTTLFRTYEYLRPAPPCTAHNAIRLIPPLGYGLVAVMFALHAVKEQMDGVALAGLAVMLPFVLTNLLCFACRKAQAPLD
ncbi:MAG TPA: carotenoid biosynthesis protein [Candidatus Hydrogenedentes bacterium]|nr:carotenoid biosynthesis protein [Candidatus Hydrogenedentota bacterium]HPG68476.1 carotenoid biosynthesis protein [Candidatus Hydrogenedentota bacterium]